MSEDPINRPPHYTATAIEPIDVIEAWGLGFHLGNAVKYIARAPHKGRELEDLKKCRWYIERAIAKLEDDGSEPELDAEDVKNMPLDNWRVPL